MSIHVPDVFYKLCCHFFTEDGSKKQFKISNKTSIVSDPFVEYLDENVFTKEKSGYGNIWDKEWEVKHVMASSHVSPDLAFYKGDPKVKESNLFGLEVKTSKAKSGDINFNSTPPCGKVVVEVDGKEMIIPCYYLFVQLTPLKDGFYDIGSMMMIDGDFINSDFELYLEATGIREKKIDLGSYKDGMDRQRPMFVFPNPLGIRGIRSERTTLITQDHLNLTGSVLPNQITKVAHLERQDGRRFFAYQAIRHLKGPFTNVCRSTETKERSKLKIESSTIKNVS